MKLCYDFSANFINSPDFSRKLSLMRSAGVSELYLFGYFYGKFEADPEMIARAAKILRDEGFTVGGISVPLGHGGNSLDLDDPSISLDVGKRWRNRVDRHGITLLNTTCIEENCLRDSARAARELYDCGFDTIFYDDDLRLAQWGAEMQGCYCPHCVAEFNEKYGYKLDADGIYSGDDEVKENWMTFSCSKITGYLKAVTPSGKRCGMMAMHNGDRRHGIDIADVRRQLPGTLVRVGELHFDDASFESPDATASITHSVKMHMAAAGDSSICYSESTVFPRNALSPSNLVKKIRLERSLGLENIYLMSGTVMLDDAYFEAIRDAGIV